MRQVLGISLIATIFLPGTLVGQDSQVPRDASSEAVPALGGALRLDPNSWEAHYNLALALIQTGDRGRAASELRTAIAQKPDYLPARNALGSLLLSRGELDAAAEQFKAVPRIDSYSAVSAFHLAAVFQMQGKYAAEAYYLRRSLASNPPQEVEFRSGLALAAALDQMGSPDGAEEELGKLVAAFPGSAEAHEALGDACGGVLCTRRPSVNMSRPCGSTPRTILPVCH